MDAGCYGHAHTRAALPGDASERLGRGPQKKGSDGDVGPAAGTSAAPNHPALILMCDPVTL